MRPDNEDNNTVNGDVNRHKEKKKTDLMSKGYPNVGGQIHPQKEKINSAA
jgi:hypothetical protein